jgi:transformation/transcription domain-associated protein
VGGVGGTSRTIYDIRDGSSKPEVVWSTPLGFRENMVSYLVRLATMSHDPTTSATLVPRALALLQLLVGPKGWTAVTVGIRFFSRALEQVRVNP